MPKKKKSKSTSKKASQNSRAAAQYLRALEGQFDKVTTRELQRYSRSQEDLDIANTYFEQDLAQIRSRSSTDFYTGIALQNADFSQTLDSIAAITKQRVGTFEGLGASAIKDATGRKSNNDARYQLNFDRSNEDLNRNENRTDARYKLSTDRLTSSKKDFQDQRSIDRNVLGIKTKSNFTQFQDNITTASVLTSNEAAKRYQPITGGGTGLQNIFNFLR